MNLDTLYTKIEQTKKKLDNHRPLTPAEVARLREDFIIENTYNSNAIEGNTLTLRETAMVLRGITIDKKPLREHLEATQHRDAFHYICELVTNNAPLTESVIKQIHSVILNDRPSDRGTYRRVPVRIMGSDLVPPEQSKIQELMTEIITEYTKAKPTIRDIATLHVKFESIHPFIDGNGRTGRMLSNLELMKSGYPPVDIKYTDRREYYDALAEFDRTKKTERFEIMFAGYILKELEKLVTILSPSK